MSHALWATPAEVIEAAKNWTIEQLVCRTYGHNWNPEPAVFVARYRYYACTQLCPRCGTERHQELSRTGQVFASWYRYPDGYLSEDLGRIAGEARGSVRIAAITRMGTTSTIGGGRDQLPHSTNTRRALGIRDSA